LATLVFMCGLNMIARDSLWQFSCFRPVIACGSATTR